MYKRLKATIKLNVAQWKVTRAKVWQKALSVYLSACLSVSNLVVIVAMWRDSTEWFTCFQFVDFQHFFVCSWRMLSTYVNEKFNTPHSRLLGCGVHTMFLYFGSLSILHVKSQAFTINFRPRSAYRVYRYIKYLCVPHSCGRFISWWQFM